MPYHLAQRLAANATTLLATLILLTGCGGGDAEVTQQPLPPPLLQPVVNYAGPAPSTADVQRFKTALWDNIATADRCGACHTQGQQTPSFARNDDINLAYSDSGALVNLSRPSESRLVTKVAGGHQCWLTSDSACADIMTTWVSNWAAGTAAADEVTTIQLQAPVLKAPGETRNFPEDPTLFADTVYPLLREYCANCHQSSAAFPVAPFVAAAEVTTAYAASKDRINLDLPDSSRFVIRLRDQFHNCWSDCQSDAQLMREAIAHMAEAIPVTGVDEQWVTSSALTLFDGTLASGGGRFDQHVIGKWEFKTGSGSTAFDTSGVEPALNLTLSGDVQWVGGYGIQLNGGKAQASTRDSRKLYTLILGSGEFAVEAWVAPGNVVQEGPSRIIGYSGGRDRRNLLLGQTRYNYDALVRHENTDSLGEPALSTPDALMLAQARLQHVVMNYDPINGRRLFVDGESVPVTDAIGGGNLLNWDDSFALVLGNEVSGDMPWSGIIRMAAIHNRALTAEQVKKNFDAGVGQQYYLLFNLADYTQQPDTYVVFTVSQYDSYSYLFDQPFFISLDPNASIRPFALRGMRIGVNGRESRAGQVFARLNKEVGANYNMTEGETISRQGTLIPIEKGPDSDEFFLTFEQLGEATFVRTEPEVIAPPVVVAHTPQSAIGNRHFAEIHASMSVLSSVPDNHPAVAASFAQLQQQLPSSTDLSSFVAANQMAVTQLAIRYCDTLVEDTGLRSQYFPSFDFSQSAVQAFTAERREHLLQPLLQRMLPDNVTTVPARGEVATELHALIDRLTDCASASQCDARHTRTVAKATCAAVLGSAVTLLQ